MVDITALTGIALKTGYFGVPGRTGGKVHLVTPDNRPVCHTPISSEAAFQWCSADIQLDYIECDRCREIARALLSWRAEQEAARRAQQTAARRKPRRGKQNAASSTELERLQALLAGLGIEIRLENPASDHDLHWYDVPAEVQAQQALHMSWGPVFFFTAAGDFVGFGDGDEQAGFEHRIPVARTTRQQR